MKIIISENQELDVKKKFIFMLLNNKNYNLIEIDDDGTIYFVKKIGDEKAEIMYDKNDGWCDISYDLISFFSTITGFERSEVQELTSNWVEHVLQMKVKYNTKSAFPFDALLNIPYK